MHEREFADHSEGNAKAEFARRWLDENTVDYWRHARLYASLDPFLAAFPGATWVTIGDGRYGRDAHYLAQKGARAVATDISDTLLKEGQESGLIHEFSRENAEALSFKDGSFDFILYKESLHHMPRPMIAVYEMLRVARKGIIFIEPNDEPVIGCSVYVMKRILKRLMMALGFGKKLRSCDTSIIRPCGRSYEETGNYVYAFSERDIEKVALGLNLPVVAFKGLNDWYLKGVEFEPATKTSALFRTIQRRIAAEDRRSRRGLSMAAPILLVACIMKEPLSEVLRSMLGGAGFKVVDLPPNPYAETHDL